MAAFEVMEMLPLALPEDWELNTTLKLALCPAARVSGRLSPPALNPAPVTGACVMVTLDPPVLVRVSAWVWLTPACTLLKVTLAGLTLRSPAGAGVAALTVLLPIPWQPSITVKKKTDARVANNVKYRSGVAFRKVPTPVKGPIWD